MKRLLFAFALLCAAPAAFATVLVPAEFREIVAGSEVILYGRVVDVRPEWTSGRRRIDSVVTVDVGTYLKGGADGRVTFRTPGGQIGRYRSVTVGAPEFRSGEEAILFLTTRAGAMPRVFGLNQGVFRVQADRTGRRMVLPAALTAVTEAPAIARRGAVARRPLALDAFAAQVREAMRQGAPR